MVVGRRLRRTSSRLVCIPADFETSDNGRNQAFGREFPLAGRQWLVNYCAAQRETEDMRASKLPDSHKLQLRAKQCRAMAERLAESRRRLLSAATGYERMAINVAKASVAAADKSVVRLVK